MPARMIATAPVRKKNGCGVRKLDSFDVQAARAAQLADETELTLHAAG
jgi:hypothetical protein